MLLNKLRPTIFSSYKYNLPLFLILVSACTGPAEGERGLPGYSCSVEALTNGALIRCEDGTSSAILNGVDGQDGQDAPPTAYTVVGLVDPCGDGPGFDEVLMKLHNGQIMAHYAGGGNLQFLTLLSPGYYVTTDSQACHFQVTANGQVVP